MFVRIHLWSRLLPDLCLLGVFISDSISLLVTTCSYFLFLPGSVSGDYIPRNLSASFRLSILLGRTVLLSNLLWTFMALCCGLSCLLYNFWYLGPHIFSLISLSKGLSILFIFSKHQLSISLISILSFILFIFVPIFHDSFLLLILCSVYSFLYKILYLKIFLFPEVGLYHYRCPS